MTTTAKRGRRPLKDRFGLSQLTRDALARAVQLRVVDAADCAVLGATHGADDAAILAELCDTAFAARHDIDGEFKHAEMVRFLDAYHAAK